jgi:hypothetical protein
MFFMFESPKISLTQEVGRRIEGDEGSRLLPTESEFVLGWHDSVLVGDGVD